MTTPHAELLLHLTFRHRDNWWVLDCEEMPGLYLAHADANKVMADFIPAWRKLNELDGDGPEPPALAAPTVEGWKWVPVEPTPEMCAAYYDLCRKQDTLAVAASDIYRVMLSSAPQQASGEKGGGT